jgi:hypothetical protein
MTVQTTNIDSTSGDAVDLTSGDEVFYTIANGVVLESQFANGVVAGGAQNFFIYNNGSIVANDIGLELEAANDHFYNERGGSVFGFHAVNMTTTGETFVNYGDVSGDIVGVFDTGGGNVISNYGTIEGPDQSLEVAGGDTITNSGIMDGAIAFTGTGTGAPTSLTNSGTITGALNSPVSLAIDNAGLWNSQAGSTGPLFDLTDSGDVIANSHAGAIDGAVTLLAGGDTFTNAGSIDGAIRFTGTGASNTLTNSGSITGNVTLAGASSLFQNHDQIYGDVTLGRSETLRNTGVIHGNVTLRALDTLNDSRGKITGAITASSNDTFVYAGLFGTETIGKFIAGTGSTHDTIQFAANDFSTFAQVHAASTQHGSDVVIRLDGTDSITLTGVTLSSLVATDFKFV